MEFEQVYDLYFQDVYRYIRRLSRQRARGGGDHQRDLFQGPAQHWKIPRPVRHSGVAVPDRQKLLHLLAAQGEANSTTG